jgi:hypothetical protein
LSLPGPRASTILSRLVAPTRSSFARCTIVAVLALGLLLGASPAAAKKYKYATGPKPQTDSLQVAEANPELVTASKKRREAPTNLAMLLLVAHQSVAKALGPAPLQPGAQVVLAPSGAHTMNFVLEYALLQEMSNRKIVTTVRRSPVPDDSVLALAATPGTTLLEYQLATARVTYLGLRGFLPGRTKVERQATVQASLTLRDPQGGQVVWVGPVDGNLIDLFPRSQQQLVEDARYPELQTPVPNRAWQSLVEPVVVVAIVAGLIALFFQNRP